MISVGQHLSVITVFLQGLLSFFSPCVLPLLPVYIGYLSGGGAVREEDGTLRYDRAKTFVHTVFFVIGISAAFFLLGLGMSALGTALRTYSRPISIVAGILIIAFGLYEIFLYGKGGVLDQEKRLPIRFRGEKMSPWIALVLGFFFSFAWTPCVGPALTSVLLMTAATSTRVVGFLYIGVYTLGFVLPFLCVGFAATSLLAFFKHHGNIVQYTVRIGGVLMIVMGALLLSGRLGTLQADGTDVEAKEVIEETEEVPSETSPQAEETPGQMPTETPRVKPTPTLTPEEVAELRKANTACDFTLQDQFGKTHSLSDYEGKVIFLNIWATWCPPCRNEMPDIQALYDKYSAMEDGDVAILGVAFPERNKETDIEGITAFLEENGYTYPTLMDTEATMFFYYGIASYPTTYMILPDGTIYGYVPGAMDLATMEEIIEQTRAEAANTQ